MSKKTPALVMLGPDPEARGGIASVQRIWLQAGLLDERPVRVLTTYRDGNALRKLATFAVALLHFLLLLASGRVAAVHAHSASNASFRRKSIFLALARLAGKPYVFHLHGGAFDHYYAGVSFLERAWIDRTLHGAAVVFTLSEGWANWLRINVGHADVRVLPNPVLPVSLPAGVAREPATLLFLGRLEDAKGVFVLVKAIARLARQFPDLRAVLAGDGDIRAVREAAERAGVLDRIETPGWVDGGKKLRLLARAGVFVLPSRFEGLPMSVLEALAAGLPVVASRVGGIPQVVRNGDNGALHEPDDVASLALALEHVLADPVAARAMGERGRRRVLADYGVERIRSLLTDVWDQLDRPVAERFAR